MPLARVGQTEDLEIIRRPFELCPEPRPLPEVNSEGKNRAWAETILPIARELGVTMVQPPIRTRTRLAHEAAAFADKVGKKSEMGKALFKAYFEHGRDIGQVEVLCDIGLSVGLDPVLLRECLEGRTLQEEVGRDLRLARDYAITVVPTMFIGGKVGLEGLVDEEEIRQGIARAKGKA